MATIYEIAEKLNISPSTVSRALTGKDYVRQEVKERVLKVAKEMGYQPNSFARGLLNKRSYTIGLVIPDITNPFFPAVARGVEDVAQRNGYNVMLCNTDGNSQKEAKYLRVLQSKQVDGVISITSQVKASHVKQLLKAGVPVVLGDRNMDVNCDFVSTDNVEGAYLVTKHLLSLGHSAIGIITGPKEVTTSKERLAGYKKALIELGLRFDADLVFEGDYKNYSGYLAAKYFLGLKNVPTAIFACNDLMAIGVMTAMSEMGYVIPDDIVLTGYDDTILASVTYPRLTTIVQPKYEIGSIACELLIKRIKDNDRPNQHVVLQPTLVVRESTVKSITVIKR